VTTTDPVTTGRNTAYSLPELIAAQITGLARRGDGVLVGLNATVSDDDRVITVTATTFDFTTIGDQRQQVLLHVGPVLPLAAPDTAVPVGVGEMDQTPKDAA
jgi:hypothetical protein